MGYTEAELIANVSTVLSDTATATWGTALIQAQMGQSIRELSRYSPQPAKSTVTFAGTARELSIAGIKANLLDIEQVEFRVDKDTKRYRSFEVRGSSVLVDISFSPAAGDTAYIWYNCPHTVSGTVTNTLNVEEERLLIELTASEIILNYGLSKIGSLSVGGKWSDWQTWAERKLAKTLSELRGIRQGRMNIEWPTVE